MTLLSPTPTRSTFRERLSEIVETLLDHYHRLFDPIPDIPADDLDKLWENSRKDRLGDES